jgi:hypothetical protein
VATSDGRAFVREGALRALGESWRHPRTVVPIARRLASDPDPAVRAAATEILDDFL